VLDLLAGSHEAHEAVNVETDGQEHLCLALGCSSVFRVCAGMDDAVHIEVQAVKLQPKRVWARRVKGHFVAIDDLCLSSL
jgi:hypothetical protein